MVNRRDRRLSRRAALRGLGFGIVATPALIALACSGSNDEGSAGGSSATSASGGERAIGATATPDASLASLPATSPQPQARVRIGANPQSLDPHILFGIDAELVTYNIFNGLLTTDQKTGALMPDLAEKWEVIDPTTIRFALRNGVKWQKGYGDFSSKDVKWSYERVLEPSTASPYRPELASLDRVDAPDASTAVMKLKQPDANFLYQIISYHQGQIMNQEAVAKAGDQVARNPVGTGAFAFESWTQNSEIVLIKNPEHYKGAPRLEKVIFRILQDQSATEVALKNRELDVAQALTTAEVISRLKSDSKMTLPRLQGQWVNVVLVGPEYEPLQKQQVRQAIVHAIDWPTVIKSTMPDTGSTSVNIIPRWMEGFTEDVPKFPFDADRAKALLREAGYERGFSVNYVNNGPASESLVLMQSYLDKVGIKLNIEQLDRAGFNLRRQRGEIQLSGRGLPGITPDQTLFTYLHPANAAPAGLNSARYNNPRVTQLLESARRELDTPKRVALWGEVQKIAMNDMYYMPNNEADSVWAATALAQNIVVNKTTNVDFWPVVINKG